MAGLVPKPLVNQTPQSRGECWLYPAIWMRWVLRKLRMLFAVIKGRHRRYHSPSLLVLATIQDIQPRAGLGVVGQHLKKH